MHFILVLALLMGSWYFRVFFYKNTCVQRQYFNVFQELIFLNSTDQRLSTLRLKLVALKNAT